MIIASSAANNSYDHTPWRVLFAGCTLASKSAKIENLTAAQIAADSATVNVTGVQDMEITRVVVSANGKWSIDAQTSITAGTVAGTYDITVTNFSDEITEGQDLQLEVYFGYPN